jgi:hypothetical protein
MTTKDFIRDDLPRTLFPMDTNQILIDAGEDEIKDYIAKISTDGDDTKAFSFLPQQRVYASKAHKHLRRTVKLDLISEYAIYDFAYRNRSLFRKPFKASRKHYGYRFEEGKAIPSSDSYRAFKSASSEYNDKYKFSLSFDVASYFNSIYHHDLVNWAAELPQIEEADVEILGKLLKEVNSGRSVDCLPQGIYPSKMIGNDFLRFVDNHFGLKSEQLIRFMDDFCLYSNDIKNLEEDFILIQELLGERGLSVNPMKTNFFDSSAESLDNEIDEMKAQLLEKRRILLQLDYDDEAVEAFVVEPLSEGELEYVKEILNSPSLEEEDAELVLSIMRDHTADVEDKLEDIMISFPNLAKNVFAFCQSVEDKELVAEAIIGCLNKQARHTEFQLFWFGEMLQRYLLSSQKAPQLIHALMNSQAATPISKAKVLEIRDKRFGLTEFRERILRNGQSDWTSWASAVGMTCLRKRSRNHVAKYFGNASQMNHIVASIVEKLD